MTETETHELDVPGARIAYDVRGDLRSGGTPLLLIGSALVRREDQPAAATAWAMEQVLAMGVEEGMTGHG